MIRDQAVTAISDDSVAGARRVSSKLSNGTPWQQIVDVAQRESVDLIVIGTPGRTGLARALVGSVAETVVCHAPCPVLAIRTDGAAKPFEHVLCPIDFSSAPPDRRHNLRMNAATS
jgi:nucleotide-binding universal stress UspA family protein